jgi:hypothetical protein
MATQTTFGPTTPTRAGRLVDASVDQTEALNRPQQAVGGSYCD